MTLFQNAALFPLHRWLDRHDTWRLVFVLVVSALFATSMSLSIPLMISAMALVFYLGLTRWAWTTNRLLR